MNKTFLLVLLAACALCVGACVHSHASERVTRDELHAFVEDAKAQYGDNERDWPIEVRAEFVSLSTRYFEGR
jgi:tRNA(Arg) A34 adenosine deaminase TadA